MENKGKGLFSRRGVLKTFGTAGAAIITAPLFHIGNSALKAVTTPMGSSNALKLGILVPSAGSYSYTSNFLNGVNLSLSEHEKISGSLPLIPFIEEANAGSVHDKLAKLIGDHDINIAIGFMNSRITPSLKEEVEKSGIVFVEANLGENFFHKEISSNLFFHSSLNLWQAHYVLGMWAAKNIGTECFCASAFFDSGYDALYAFEAGFASGGGTVIGTGISGSPMNDLSPVEVANNASHSGAPMVFANYSGPDAAIFLSAFKNSGGNAKKRILASSMMIQPRLLAHLGQNAVGITSASTWALESSQKSAAFGAKYRSMYNIESDDFAVLGYDTSELIMHAAIESRGIIGEASRIKSFENTSFNSARGALKINPNTHGSESQVFIIEMARPDDGHIISEIKLPDSITNADFRLTESMRSGSIQQYPIGA